MKHQLKRFTKLHFPTFLVEVLQVGKILLYALSFTINNLLCVDSEDSESVVVSDTNYSPYSTDDEEIKTPHADSDLSEKNQHVSSMSKHYGNFDREQSLVPYLSPVSSSSLNVSPPHTTERCSSTLSSYYGKHFPFATPTDLSFLTPVMHREKPVGLLTTNPGFDRNSERNCSLYVTPLQQVTAQVIPIQEKLIAQDTDDLLYKTPYYPTPVQKKIPEPVTPAQKNSFFSTRMHGDQNNPFQPQSSMHTPVISLDDTPAQRKKRVRFAVSPRESSICDTLVPFNSILPKEDEHIKTPRPDSPDRVQRNQFLVEKNEEQIIATTHSKPTQHQGEPSVFIQASDKTVDADEETENKSKKKRTSDVGPIYPPRKQITGRKNKTSFNKKLNISKVFHIPCYCRTVVRKVKIRDVGTQTSP